MELSWQAQKADEAVRSEPDRATGHQTTESSSFFPAPLEPGNNRSDPLFDPSVALSGIEGLSNSRTTNDETYGHIGLTPQRQAVDWMVSAALS
jgi:hypothetical protein